jgi:predicted small lipoprotein YifL
MGEAGRAGPVLPSPAMLRDPRRALRAARHVAVLAAAFLAVVSITGCGIKGPLKRVDAPASATTAVPPAKPPDPTLP